MHKAYLDLVAEAERAVSTVKDPELRRVAFEKVLEDLLSKASEPRARARVTATASKTDDRQLRPKPKGKRSGPQAHVEDLVAEGFFAQRKTISEVKGELENRGHHIPLTSLSGPLQTLCQKRSLRRQKVEGQGKKKTFAYSNW